MNWLSFFSRTENISAAEARQLMTERQPESYQLLDVRQPKEYERGHIPGAILIPLKELPDRVQEMDPAKETIVYCHSGVRSKAGFQTLKDHGFSRVFNMSGGISSYEGKQATGPEELGMDYFLGGDFESVYAMAMAMEEGLQQFYLQLAEDATDESARELLTLMARLEDGHIAKLTAQYPALGARTKPGDGSVAEGGLDPAEFRRTYGSQLDDIETVIEVGMLFEAQALDLYTRLARDTEDAESKEFFTMMAGEELHHLERLTKELERRVS